MAEKQHKIATAVHKTGRTAKNTVIVMFQTVAVVAISLLLLLALALLVNQVARWNAKRKAPETAAAEAARAARENFVVIGVEGEKAVGFLAMRVDREGKQVFAIAIPDGAFIDVPGQGFLRIGEAYGAGPEAIATAISNYLTVPFKAYIVVPAAVYRDAMARQVAKGIPEASMETNLSSDELGAMSAAINEVPQASVAMVPLPVKPIKLGDQTYYEPQRDEVADLLKSWWNIDPSDQNRITRAVLYNGAGTPGIAGEAAQQLIRAGIRVVDTQNADNFNYAKTQIIVRRGDEKQGRDVKAILGVGEVVVEPSSQDVTDLVIIIGKDYRPPAKTKEKDK